MVSFYVKYSAVTNGTLPMIRGFYCNSKVTSG